MGALSAKVAEAKEPKAPKPEKAASPQASPKAKKPKPPEVKFRYPHGTTIFAVYDEADQKWDVQVKISGGLEPENIFRGRFGGIHHAIKALGKKWYGRQAKSSEAA